MFWLVGGGGSSSSNENVTSLKLRHEPFGNRDNSRMLWMDFCLLTGVNNTCKTNGTFDACKAWRWNCSCCCIRLDRIPGRSVTWVVFGPERCLDSLRGGSGPTSKDDLERESLSVPFSNLMWAFPFSSPALPFFKSVCGILLRSIYMYGYCENPTLSNRQTYSRTCDCATSYTACLDIHNIM